ncbi:hybrid sensor histidine kinase/response regulator [Erythrobacter oryzae]|uniref:hybrid sensor histidine kinase/response regulator n=1 Tax=Erythrobacter oryzae TaxID=3019556 RepID=UPI002556453B|nr:ATP-binding protein [Erythrobacter sp. COR-2]
MERTIERGLDHERHRGSDPPDADDDRAPPDAAPMRAPAGGTSPARAHGHAAHASAYAAGSSAATTASASALSPGTVRRFATRPASATPERGTHARAEALHAILRRWLSLTGIAAGPADRRSLAAALIGGAGYLVIACLSLALARAGETVSPIWLPNACLVAMLLRARLSCELPLLAACFAASLAANAVVQLPDSVALVFSLANIGEVVLILALTRVAKRGEPDMTRLGDLARFVWAGALVGPLVSALLIMPVLGSSWDSWRAGALVWFLTDSMAMVLIVPPVLLLVDRLRGRLAPAPAGALESAALLGGGMVSAYLVFNQTHYPLMFLIQPVTLLHAFRLGSLGSALNVAGVAVVAGAMTFAGHGPIAATGGAMTELHLLQAFVAANFLTGLPVAAILAGRDRMMARLEAGKREVDLLADNISDAILRFDLAGMCTYASPSVAEVMGTPPETFLGRHASARLHPDAQGRAGEAMERLLAGTSERERVTYRRFADAPDGSPVFLESDCVLVRDPVTGAPEAVVVAARDVTERVELELLLTRARRHAENAARAKSEFLANMSHEIRTPMNGVLGFAELMLQGELAADQRRFAELIVQSGRSMMMLLNDVLDLSKIESGQFAIDRAPVNLHASLAECAALHRPAAERKGLALTLACECDGESDCRYSESRPPWVLTDGLRLRQIMLNLIGNAVKFTEAGAIAVSYRITRHEVRVTVADSGIGISPLQLESIFLPFTQGEASTARRYGGTGLGLSISRQLAALLGGRIEVESTPGEGSRFALVLPATLAPPAAPPVLAEPPTPLMGPGAAAQDRPGAGLAPSRILLVEDHDINRLLVTEMLERCGQEVDVAHDGNEAIAMVIDSVMRARPYDLVLMDVQMPDCDGLAATRAIRAEGIGPGLLPVIALTANAYPEDVAAARAAGMQGHLAKPVVFAQLARALQRWLPTRIVEAGPGGAAPGIGAEEEGDEGPSAPARIADPAARASALARSPRLVARWQARRMEAVAAVAAGLADGSLALAGARAPGEGAGEGAGDLARMLHKLAGTAAMFGEAGLGIAAAALERALVTGEDAATCTALAARLIAEAEAHGAADSAAAGG